MQMQLHVLNVVPAQVSPADGLVDGEAATSVSPMAPLQGFAQTWADLAAVMGGAASDPTSPSFPVPEDQAQPEPIDGYQDLSPAVVDEGAIPLTAAPLMAPPPFLFLSQPVTSEHWPPPKLTLRVVEQDPASSPLRLASMPAPVWPSGSVSGPVLTHLDKRAEAPLAALLLAGSDFGTEQMTQREGNPTPSLPAEPDWVTGAQAEVPAGPASVSVPGDLMASAEVPPTPPIWGAARPMTRLHDSGDSHLLLKVERPFRSINTSPPREEVLHLSTLANQGVGSAKAFLLELPLGAVAPPGLAMPSEETDPSRQKIPEEKAISALQTGLPHSGEKPVGGEEMAQMNEPATDQTPTAPMRVAALVGPLLPELSGANFTTEQLLREGKAYPQAVVAPEAIRSTLPFDVELTAPDEARPNPFAKDQPEPVPLMPALGDEAGDLRPEMRSPSDDLSAEMPLIAQEGDPTVLADQSKPLLAAAEDKLPIAMPPQERLWRSVWSVAKGEIGRLQGKLQPWAEADFSDLVSSPTKGPIDLGGPLTPSDYTDVKSDSQKDALPKGERRSEVNVALTVRSDLSSATPPAAPSPQSQPMIEAAPSAQLGQDTLAATSGPDLHRLTPAHLPPAEAARPAPSPLPLQIISALAETSGPITEVRLRPEELGHLRIEMRQDGDRLVMTFSAERPETLDLLRRHSAELAQDLRNAGHGALDLNFGPWARQDEKGAAPTRDEAAVMDDMLAGDPRIPLSASPLVNPSASAVGRLYLRI